MGSKATQYAVELETTKGKLERVWPEGEGEFVPDAVQAQFRLHQQLVGQVDSSSIEGRHVHSIRLLRTVSVDADGKTIKALDTVSLRDLRAQRAA
jgi:hypothetical protein